MQVIGLEKDDRGASTGRSITFADATGLDLVLDDGTHDALLQFFPRIRGEGQNASDFVVLNGVNHSPSHQQWEILHIESIRPSINSIRDKIDSVEAASVPAVPPVLSAPALVDGKFSFQVEGTAGASVEVQISRNGMDWETNQTIILGDGPTNVSEPLMEGPEPVFFRVLIP